MCEYACLLPFRSYTYLLAHMYPYVGAHIYNLALRRAATQIQNTCDRTKNDTVTTITCTEIKFLFLCLLCRRVNTKILWYC